ncbi:MAG TPA: EamA family transporter, partial [Nitrospinota bacterium]|nr:EamA family transporter [Nitrospinota bacterium]
ILIAVVFLGERPSIFLLAGALLIVGGIMNVVMDRSKIRIHLRTALLGLLPALVYSTSPVFMRLGLLAQPDRILGNAISGLGALFFMFSMTPAIPRDNRWNVDRRAFPTFLAAGVFYSTAFFAYFSAMGASSVSFTTPLIYTMALFSALISRIFFQQLEQITWRLAISAVVVCIGIALISISRGG